MRNFLLFLLVTCAGFTASASFSTPGTGITYTLEDLVSVSGGTVTTNGTEFFFNDSVFININDALNILTNEKVFFAANTYLRVSGTLTINPPQSVLFTAADPATKFLGIWIMNNNTSVLKKLTMEYGNSLRLFDCSILVDSCVFRNNSFSSAFGGSTINLFRSNSTISNSLFIDGGRAAIEGGGNISNAPKILNNIFINNVSTNINKPQINLGNSGADTTKLIGNYIYGGPIMSGGVAFYPFVTNVPSYYLVKENTIRKNRYGITIIGGANINSLVSYNVIDSNNIQGDPNLGGSGISFNGGAAGNHQNSIVTGNRFTANLWGITILLGSRPNLGNLSNVDTTDDGKNKFINNTNSTTPNISVYNNSPYIITAEGNYWNTTEPANIPATIFDVNDDLSLGQVIYSNAILPVSKLLFNARQNGDRVSLNWTIQADQPLAYFDIEKSSNGTTFYSIGTLNANLVLNSDNYFSFSDANFTGNSWYRLKLVDKDGRFVYSIVRLVKKSNIYNDFTIYPTVLKAGETIHINYKASIAGDVALVIYNENGQVLSKKIQQVVRGENSFVVNTSTKFRGKLYIKLLTEKDSFVRGCLLQ